VPFVADDLGAWLVALLADAGRKKLTTLALGTDQERALRRAATTAVKLTARDLRPQGGERAEELAMVVSEVFRAPVPDAPLAEHPTVLEALQAGIAGQLTPLDDRSLTGTGKSSADVLEVSAAVLAQKLTGHLVREIVVRGARGGPLAPLAAQLNHDATHLQGQRIENILGRLDDEVRKALAPLDTTHVAAALAQLPAPVAGVIGRDAELAMLAGLLDPAGAAGPVVVSAVTGLAGVGKTTLAVEAGHAALRRGWFVGGVLFLDLHGYDDKGVEPGQALDALLRALGVHAEHIPPSDKERAGLYRSVLAERTGPVLVIADNASSEAQVRPLLPGTGPHKVVVTSRHTLAGLGARLVDVMILDNEAGVELLDRALRTARPEDDRISGDREAAARLAGLCGGLPLALQITAALLVADPTLSTAELVQELVAEQGGLDLLTYDDGSGPGTPSVAAAFELSYRRLEEVPARVFRLLPVNPGPDISTPAAAVLADLPVSKVRKVLAGLARAHLAEAANVAGRWRMHDLVRLYAQRLPDDHADADGRERACDRLLDYYLRTALAADRHVRALPGMAPPEDFTDRGAALAWLDAERPSLIAAVSMAADTGRDQIALHLPNALVEYFGWRRRFDDWLATINISLGAARRLHDRHAEGITLDHLGSALRHLRRFDEAITMHQNAAAILQETADLHAESSAQFNLGMALRQTRRFDEAITAFLKDLEICYETDDEHGAATTMNSLGICLRETRRFDEAIAAHQNAAALYRKTNDQRGEGLALNNLGNALSQVRRFDEAITVQQNAAAILRETDDRHNLGMTLMSLGTTQCEIRQFDEAIAAHQDAASIFRETGDQHSEGMALSNLGNARSQVRQFDEAIAAHQDAASIFRETGDPHSLGAALHNLGRTLEEMQRFDEAITAYQEAAALYRETGDQHGEAGSLNDTGITLQAARRFDEAITAHRHAAALYRQTGDRYGEDWALSNLEQARAAQT
jgi:tetratricopeptide (TPR) repeat protein